MQEAELEASQLPLWRSPDEHGRHKMRTAIDADAPAAAPAAAPPPAAEVEERKEVVDVSDEL